MKATKRELREPSTNSPRAGPTLSALLAAGDVRGARAHARELLADASAPDDERAAANDALARTGIDRFALCSALGVLSVQLVWIAVLFLA